MSVISKTTGGVFKLSGTVLTAAVGTSIAIGDVITVYINAPNSSFITVSSVAGINNFTLAGTQNSSGGDKLFVFICTATSALLTGQVLTVTEDVSGPSNCVFSVRGGVLGYTVGGFNNGNSTTASNVVSSISNSGVFDYGLASAETVTTPSIPVLVQGTGPNLNPRYMNLFYSTTNTITTVGPYTASVPFTTSTAYSSVCVAYYDALIWTPSALVGVAANGQIFSAINYPVGNTAIVALSNMTVDSNPYNVSFRGFNKAEYSQPSTLIFPNVTKGDGLGGWKYALTDIFFNYNVNLGLNGSYFMTGTATYTDGANTLVANWGTLIGGGTIPIKLQGLSINPIAIYNPTLGQSIITNVVASNGVLPVAMMGSQFVMINGGNQVLTDNISTVTSTVNTLPSGYPYISLTAKSEVNPNIFAQQTLYSGDITGIIDGDFTVSLDKSSVNLPVGTSTIVTLFISMSKASTYTVTPSDANPTGNIVISFNPVAIPGVGNTVYAIQINVANSSQSTFPLTKTISVTGNGKTHASSFVIVNNSGTSGTGTGTGTLPFSSLNAGAGSFQDISRHAALKK